MKRSAWLMFLAAACLLATACGGSSSKSSTSAKATVGGKLVIANETGSTWTCQFNPFVPADQSASLGFIYEALEPVNILKYDSSGNPLVTPWLATSSAWSNGFKTLTFTIRSGAKWSDGQPFSAADVAYTFNAMKSDKAIDLNALWPPEGGPLTSVTQSGDQVVFSFSAPAQSYFYYVADMTPIVPQHLWSTLNQSKLHTYSDTKPVGTGPYLDSNCAPQNIKYLRNPTFWQTSASHPVPAIAEVDYPAFLANEPTNEFLAQGAAQWGGQYVPNVQSFYVAKDPVHRHIWYAPVLNVSIVPNLTNSVLSQLPVRQAISMAINRPQVAQLVYQGQLQPANQTGVITPTYESWYDPSLPKTATYDPAKAQQVLQSAGFTKGSDGIYQDKSGNKLSFVIKSITGYSDWDAALALITQQLKAVGIAVTAQDENTNIYTTDLQSGHFQLAYAGSGGPSPIAGPSPYYELRGLLFSGNIGSTNYSRYKSASTDALFDQYPGVALSQQQQIIHKIQQVMLSEIPFIPVTQGVDWYQYDTTHIGGWPTEANPFAQPSPYVAPDNDVVLTHLYPTQ
jgi:peptide/nickel transport system substrate-binding protein